MPGPKRLQRNAIPGDGLSIVSDIDVSDDGLECPSTEGYVTARNVRTKTPDGVVEDIDYVWTRAGLSKWLAACPKVQVFIPLDPANDGKDASKARPQMVFIDGFPIPVKKGRAQLVALPVAEIIQNMQNEYRTAQSQGIDLYTINPEDPGDRGYEVPTLAAAG